MNKKVKVKDENSNSTKLIIRKLCPNCKIELSNGYI